jgi:hypothetical protein
LVGGTKVPVRFVCHINGIEEFIRKQRPVGGGFCALRGQIPALARGTAAAFTEKHD